MLFNVERTSNWNYDKKRSVVLSQNSKTRSKSLSQSLSQSSNTIKGGCRRAEKSGKVLMMMMKAAKLGWAGPGAGQE